MNMKQRFTRKISSAIALLIVVGLAACGSVATTSVPASVATIAPTVAQSVPADDAATTSAPASVTTIAPTVAQSAPANDAATVVPQAAPATKINLNTATAEQILAIPNTGNRMVREFGEYRPYTSITQFRKEIGKYVDDAQVAEYEQYVYVPVSPNTADAATLQQLPGVTAAIADQLIAARPFASRDAFIAKLGELTSTDQANTASAYVEAQ